jgi:uncharacterized protein (TIGR00290 family)
MGPATVETGSGRRPVVLSWSSGKDSAYALHSLRRGGRYEVVGLLTTVGEAFDRVSIHGVRAELLERQAASVGLPVERVPIPYPCPNEEYERRMASVLERLRSRGVFHVAFGDLFLEDLRAYREERLRSVGMEAIFPLWGRETAALAREMIEAGVRARLSCVDLQQLDRSFAGRSFDPALLRDLPAAVDPCGERGEFHTFVSDAPGFRSPVPVRVGETVERDGAAYADLLPDPGPSHRAAARAV